MRSTTPAPAHLITSVVRLAGAASRAAREGVRSLRGAYPMRRPVMIALAVWIIFIAVENRLGPRPAPADTAVVHFLGRAVELQGRVARHPDPRPNAAMFTVAVETVRPFDGDQGRVSASGRVLVRVAGGAPDGIAPGDRISVAGRIEPASSARTPGAFDYAAFLRIRGVDALLYAGAAKNLGPSGSSRWLRAGWRVRERVADVFQRRLGPPEATVLSGLIIGARPRFHPEIRRIFIESGTMHILVASGSNVAFVVMAVFLVGRFVLRLPRRPSLALSVPAAWLYAAVVGADPPIVRAATMATVGIVSYLLRREDRPVHALALAALVLLALDPQTLFDVGFQMSFLTVFGLLHFGPAFVRVASRFPAPGGLILQIALATVTAQLWIFPITAAVFKRFFPISIVANMAVMPLAGLGFAAGGLLAAADALAQAHAVFEPVAAATAWVVQRYAGTVIRLVGFFADGFGAGIWLAPPRPLWTAAWYAACLAVPFAFASPPARWLLAAAAPILLFGFARGPSPPRDLRVTALDIGTRTAFIAESADGATVLVGPGALSRSDPAERVIMPFIKEKRIRRLDAIVVPQTDPARADALKSFFRYGVADRVIVMGDGGAAWNRALEAWNGFATFVSPGEEITVRDLRIEAIPGSAAFTADAPILVRDDGYAALLAHALPLKSQRLLAARGEALDLVAARFSPRLKWDRRFTGGVRPDGLIEVGYPSRGVAPPESWTSRPIKVVQDEGWVEWIAGAFSRGAGGAP